MKKILMLLVSIIMVFSTFTAVYANETYELEYPVELISEDLPLLIATQDNSIKVMQDGEYIDFTDANGVKVEPQIINDRTMVPFRKIFNSLGVVDENITWIAETRTVIAKKDNVEIELQIDNNVAKKTVSGDTTSITLDAAPVIYENRTLVPVRFIAESMEKLVGWDSNYRTVIILDKAKIQKQFEEAVPKYFELVSLQSTSLNTFEGVMVLEGELEYTNKSDKTIGSTLKFTVDIDVKKAERAIYVEFDVKFTGKGVLYEALKENKMTELDFTIIITEDKMYITTSLFGEELEGKWLVLEDESLVEIMEELNATYTNSTVNEILEINEDDLDIYTYEELQLTIKILEELLGDDKITISGTKTKKYEVDIDIIGLLKLMEEYGAGLEIMDMIEDLEMVAGGTIEDGVATTSFAELTFKMEEGDEKLSMEIEATSEIENYNKTVKIDIPNENEIMSMEQ